MQQDREEAEEERRGVCDEARHTCDEVAAIKETREREEHEERGQPLAEKETFDDESAEQQELNSCKKKQIGALEQREQNYQTLHRARETKHDDARRTDSLEEFELDIQDYSKRGLSTRSIVRARTCACAHMRDTVYRYRAHFAEREARLQA